MVKRASLGLSPSKTAGGLIFQVLGLVALYWLLRSADVTAKLIGGLTSGVRWLRAPIGVGQGVPT